MEIDRIADEYESDISPIKTLVPEVTSELSVTKSSIVHPSPSVTQTKQVQSSPALSITRVVGGALDWLGDKVSENVGKVSDRAVVNTNSLLSVDRTTLLVIGGIVLAGLFLFRSRR